MNRIAFTWSMGLFRQCNTSSLLMTCPSPGLVDEEAQDHDTSHSFYMTTTIYAWLVTLNRICLDRVA